MKGQVNRGQVQKGLEGYPELRLYPKAKENHESILSMK